jgi:antitoxin ParD1/3/4
MEVHLTEDLAKLVQEQVESGRYGSADEVISEALHVLEQWDQELEARATAFKAEIEKRLADGPATPMDFAAVKRTMREQAEARKGDRHEAGRTRAGGDR